MRSNSKTIQTLLILFLAAGLSGCQSGPRWAWWKQESAPEDTSLVARSAAPALPSTQATPQALTATAEKNAPAFQPSKVAAVASTTLPAISIPPISSTTIAAAPTASYPPSSATSLVSSPITPVTAAPSTSEAAQTGPYDPKAYSATAAVSPVSSATGEIASKPAAPSNQRYGGRYAVTNTTPIQAPPKAGTAASPPFTTPPATTPPTGGRYGSTGNRYANASKPMGDLPPSQGDLSSQNVSLPPVSPASVTTIAATTSQDPSQASTIRMVPLPGQYRPGGTTSYSTERVDVASLPGVPATSTTPPATTTER